MFSGVTMFCFVASYGVAWTLEISRLVFHARIRTVVMLIFALAGLLAHGIYLYQLAADEVRQGLGVFSSWYDWCVLASAVLAVAYVGLALRRPQNSIGLFLLPLVLGLLVVAQLCADIPPFPRARAVSLWRLMHGLSLLMGTVAVTLGFGTGIMYLVQSYRLKHKLPPRQGLRLPTLEWLQRFNTEALWISAGLIAWGVISGVVLNLSRGDSGLLWTDPVIVTSSLLFTWLLLVILFESFYRPARQGRKVAYLTMASFVFLGLALVMVLFSRHGTEYRHTGSSPDAGSQVERGLSREPGEWSRSEGDLA
jgi:ABC-type uncharacterized transport system permease subunit